MDEYLSEKEQLESLKAWLRENGAWMVIGVAAGALAVGGWRWWQSRVETADLDASTRYVQLLDTFSRADTTHGLEQVEQLAKDHPGSPYVDQARLAAARVLVESDQLDRAAAQLTAVMQNSKDKDLATAARLRLGRLQVAQGKPDAALATLGTADRGGFQARFAEARGDADYARNDRAGALREYRLARAAAGPAQGQNDPLDLKINDLSDVAAPAPGPGGTHPAAAPAAGPIAMSAAPGSTPAAGSPATQSKVN